MPRSLATPPKPEGLPLTLLERSEAEAMARIFEVLASPTRLCLLQALKVLEDPCLSDLAASVGMKPQAVCNQLRKLVDLGVLTTRRHGTHAHYQLASTGISRLLQEGRFLQRQQP